MGVAIPKVFLFRICMARWRFYQKQAWSGYWSKSGLLVSYLPHLSIKPLRCLLTALRLSCEKWLRQCCVKNVRTKNHSLICFFSSYGLGIGAVFFLLSPSMEYWPTCEVSGPSVEAKGQVFSEANQCLYSFQYSFQLFLHRVWNAHRSCDQNGSSLTQKRPEWDGVARVCLILMRLMRSPPIYKSKLFFIFSFFSADTAKPLSRCSESDSKTVPRS